MARRAQCPDQKGDPIGTTEVMTFYPTMEEFGNFPAYIKYMESMGAHKSCGIARVIPPPEWSPRPTKGTADYDDAKDYVIENPVREQISGSAGIFTKYNRTFRRKLSVREFEQYANKPEFLGPPRCCDTMQDIEQYYWKNACYGEPIYGADTPGSLTEPQVKEWNVQRLGTILDIINSEGNGSKVLIKGVNTAYLYFGMWKTTFPWHVEDVDLYSINYLHYGEAKFWYGIADRYADAFERAADAFFPHTRNECPAYLRHKMHMISVNHLTNRGIPVGKCVQRAGHFMITFPRGYHAGFNTGYNCAESTNFASERWVDIGAKAKLCTCTDDAVTIDMSPFMYKYRFEKYNEWRHKWYGMQELSVDRMIRNGTLERHALDHSDHTQYVRPDEPTAKTGTKKRRTHCPKRTAPAKSRAAPVVSPDSSLDDETSPCDEKRPRVSADEPNGSVDNTTASERLRKSFGELADSVERLMDKSAAGFAFECDYNQRQVLHEPHCSVCQYFVSRHNMSRTETVPARSRRLVPGMCFVKSHVIAQAHRRPLHKLPTNLLHVAGYEEKDIGNRLLQCNRCHVVVHAGCYGVTESTAEEATAAAAATAALPSTSDSALEDWQCCRCREPDCQLITCSLCPLRGGALMCLVDEDGQKVWAHAVCVLFCADTSISSAKQLFHMQNTHARGSCQYCGQRSGMRAPCAACLNDKPEEKAMKMHITCARQADGTFEVRDWPVLVAPVCHAHKYVDEADADRQLDSDDQLPDIAVGERVIAYLDGGVRVCKGKVVEVKEVTYCCVQFDDGSFTNDTFLEDVYWCACKDDGCNGSHVTGAKCTIRWPDGQTYHGHYKGLRKAQVYKVRLHGKTSTVREVVDCSREELYGPTESLPDSVSAKLIAPVGD